MPKKKYTELEKLKYHHDREYSCGRFGLKFGGPKHTYSFGFNDGVSGFDNTAAVRSESGRKMARVYSTGYKRGQAAARSYFKKTGKQLSDEKFKLNS